MQRRLGTSILSVLSLTIGLLVAEYAFAPLREPYPATDKSAPQSDAESTASPREAEPAAPTDQNQPAPVERPDAAGEADGDPLFASVARPVIDAVWQPSAGGAVRVSAVSTAAFAPSESSTIASIGVASSGGGVSNLGGGFFSTGAGGSAPQSATPSGGGSGGTSAPTGTSGSGTGPVVVEDSSTDPDTVATETLAMNPAPGTSAMDGVTDAATLPGETAMNTAPGSPTTGSPVTDGAIAPDAMMAMNDVPASPPMDGMTDSTIGNGPNTESVPASVPFVVTPEEEKQTVVMEDSMPLLPPMSVSEPVEVPEPLSSSLFLLAVLLGGVQHFFSRKRAS